MKRIFQHLFVVALSLSFMSNAAYAAVISTEAALAAQQRGDTVAHISAILLRDDVRAALVQRGVDPSQAMARVNALTPSELAELESRLDSLPAGGIGVIEVLGITAVVLLILELLGVTNVFTKL